MKEKKTKVWMLLPLVLIPLVIVYYVGDDKTFISVIWGIVVSSILMGVGFFSLKIALNRSMKIFLGTVVGGILFRLVAILASGLYVFWYSDLPIRSFFISLLGYYLFYQFVEIFYFNRGLKESIKNNAA